MRDLTIISKIALIATRNISFEEQMNMILETIGKYLQVSRTYIFVDDLKNYTTSNAFEWCNIGVTSEIENNQNISYNLFPSFRILLKKNGLMSKENIKMLPVDICQILEKQNIKSISVYPLFINNKIRGFIGFDECETYRLWTKSDERILETLSGIVSNMYEKNQILKEFNLYKNDVDNFFDTIEEFIVISDYKGNILFTNKYARLSLGYSREKLMNMTIIELHPKSRENEVRHKMMEIVAKKINHCPVEMVDKNNKVITVETRTWLGKWRNQECIIALSKNMNKDEEALDKFRILFRKNPAPMLLVSVKTERFMDINAAFTEKFGYKIEDIRNIKVQDLDIVIDKYFSNNICKKFFEIGKIRDVEIKIAKKNGELVIALVSGDIIEIQSEQYYIAVIVDITVQKKLLNLYNIEKNRLKSIIDSSNIGTWEWEVDTGKITINEIWLKLIGYDYSTYDISKIRNWMSLVHPEDKCNVLNKLRKHMKSESSFYDVDYRMKTIDNKWLWINDRGKIIEWTKEGKPLRMFGTHTDINEKKDIETKIKELSIRDHLTNIYNRRYIYERLSSEIARSYREKSRFSVAILDIDRFKVVNDLYGHVVGDYILKEFSKLINNNLRVYDLLGRYGGEEFIVIMYGIGKSGGAKIIERILDKVREKKYIYDKYEISITFSAGVADISEFNFMNVNNEKLISLADHRLYEAKKTGRNRVIF